MSHFLRNNFYPQQVFKPDDGDGGSGGGGDDDKSGDDDASKQGDDDKSGGDDDDKGDDDKKGLIDKKDITGDDDKGDDDAKKDDDKQKDDDDKKKDEDKKAERPEFLLEKFWDPDKGEPRLESMAKAYKDLEAKLGNNKAPDEYKIEIDDNMKAIFGEKGADEDPLFGWFKEHAKDQNFTQETFDGLLKGFSEAGAKFLSENTPDAVDIDAEKEKLGKNSEAVIENQVQFISSMYKRGAMDEDSLQEVLILTETAAGIKALQAIRSDLGDRQEIPMNLNAGGGVKTADELRTMQADPKFGVDQEYTAQVNAEYEKKYGTGKSGESQRSSL